MASVTSIPREREAEAALSVPDAAERTLEAARRLATDWVELARLEAAHTLRRSLGAAALVTGGIALLALAWIAAAVAGALALRRVLEPDASVACVALAHALLGIAALLLARRRFARAEDTPR